MDLQVRARAAIARLAITGCAVFGFNPRQKRGPDGRWIKMDGPGSAGGQGGKGRGSGQRRGPGGGPGRDRGEGAPTTPKNADHPARAVVAEARRLEAEQEADGTPPNEWMQDALDKVDRALDEGDEKTVEEFLPAIERSNKLLRRLLGEDEPDLGDGVARGIRGFRGIQRQQKGNIKLTREQIQGGLEEYLSNPRGYKAINQMARDRSVPFDKMAKAQQERIRQLDRIASVFEQDATTLQQDTEVWRGVRDPGTFLGDLKPGVEFIDDAPTSTSMDKKWAANFATDWGKRKTRASLENSAIFKIRLKKGQKGLLNTAVAGEFGNPVGWEQEREMMLPPGSRFRVLSKTDDTDVDGKKVPTYEVEVVETPVLPPRAPTKRASGKAEEPGRNLKKAGDLPPLERQKVVALMQQIRDEGGHASTDAPEIQDAMIEAIKRDIDLNTRSAKLILKDLNKFGGIRW